MNIYVSTLRESFNNWVEALIITCLGINLVSPFVSEPIHIDVVLIDICFFLTNFLVRQ